MEGMEALVHAWNWYLSLGTGWMWVVGIVVGLTAWSVTGLPFGLWNGLKLRSKLSDDDGWGARVFFYAGATLICSLGGLLGTLWLTYAGIRGLFHLVFRRKKKVRVAPEPMLTE